MRDIELRKEKCMKISLDLVVSCLTIDLTTRTKAVRSSRELEIVSLSHYKNKDEIFICIHSCIGKIMRLLSTLEKFVGRETI